MNPAGAEVPAVPAGLVYTHINDRETVATPFMGAVQGAKFTAWPDGWKVKTTLVDKLQTPFSKRGGGARGVVKGITPQARRRLRQTLAGVNCAAPCLFLTCTYPAGDAPTDAARLKADLARFGKRFVRQFPQGSFVWVLELHESGVPHLHLLLWGPERAEYRAWYRALRAWAPTAWYEACRTGNPKHLGAGTKLEYPQKPGHGLNEYLAKYCSKGRLVDGAGVDGAPAWGRWWGAVHREAIPWAAAEEHAIPWGVAVRVMRWQRKAGTPVTTWARKRAGWTRPAFDSKARWTVPGRKLPSLTRVGPPGPWLRALGLAWAAELGVEHAPYYGFGAWARAH